MVAVSNAGRGRRARALLTLVGVLALAGGCGSGGTTSTTQQFTFQAVGAAGGVVEAGPVKVTIPPGALAQDTGVAILPQATPLPIVGPDACQYSYVGPIYCCGPVGQNLLVNGTIRMFYDEGLIPPGFTEADLVLLEWDNGAGVMRPRPVPPVEQNTQLNFFQDPAYAQLGHVAIGLRDCQNANLANLLVQNGGALQLAKVGAGSGEGASPAPLLWSVDVGSGLPALPLPPSVLVPTGGLHFNGFVPSPDQQRVLFGARDPTTSDLSVHTVRVDGVGLPITIAADDPPNNVFLQTYDPMYGWLQQGGADHAYYVQYVGSSMSVEEQGAIVPEPLPRYEVWRRIGTATAPATRQHFTDGSVSFLEDLRQSVGGAFLSAFSFDFFGPPNFVDEANIPAGTPASLGLVPPSDGPQPPRFMTASDDLYMVTTNGQEVNRHTPAGAFVSTLFTLFVPTMQAADQIVDFALAPDDDTFAAVVYVESKGNEYYLWMGTLADGVQASYFLGTDMFVNEMIWHPMQTGVFLDLSGSPVGLYTMQTDDGNYITQTDLVTFGMHNVDVNRLDGRIATLTTDDIFIDKGTAAFLPGIYIWLPDASDRVQIFPSDINDPQSVRWQATWRHAAGRSSSRVR